MDSETKKLLIEKVTMLIGKADTLADMAIRCEAELKDLRQLLDYSTDSKAMCLKCGKLLKGKNDSLCENCF